MNFTSKKDTHIVTLVDYSNDGYVALAIDGDEVLYIDSDGVNLIPDCSNKLPIDEEGCLKIRRP